MTPIPKDIGNEAMKVAFTAWMRASGPIDADDRIEAACRAYLAHLRPTIEAAAREAALREAANRALLSVSAIRSVCDMHGAVSCSLQNQGKDCLCQEREEQAEYINQKILALIKKEPTNAV